MNNYMFQDKERAHQAMMHSQINRNIIKNNLNTDSNTKPQEVVVESDNMWQIILIDPTQDYQKAIPQSIIPIIFQENRQQLKYLAGMMLKKSSHFIIGFQQKYCTLDNRKLNYYHSDKPNQLEGSLNFDLQEYLYSEKRNAQNQIIEFKLIPKGCKYKFIFKNENLQETLIGQKLFRNIWFNQMEKQNKLPIQVKFQNFGNIINFHTFKYKKNVIMETQFYLNQKVVQQQLQECFLDGNLIMLEFCIKKINNFLYMRQFKQELEHLDGVFNIYKLDYLKQQEWYNYYEKICIRKLNYSKKNDPGVQYRFLNFINENIGNDYNLNIGKLFRFTSKIKTTSNDTKEEKKRSFFCSELVAKAYKEMGLIDQVKSSTQYHPNDFTQDKQLCLLNGAALGPEYLVLFEG